MRRLSVLILMALALTGWDWQRLTHEDVQRLAEQSARDGGSAFFFALVTSDTHNIVAGPFESAEHCRDQAHLALEGFDGAVMVLAVSECFERRPQESGR